MNFAWQKIKGRIGGFLTGKKTNQELFRAPSFYRGFDVFSLFPVVSYGNQHFRIGTLRVLLSQILNFTTSDTRQDGQSPPFTASSSQRVRGMRNCRASIVAETEKPFLIHGASAPISTAVCFVDSRKSTRDC